MDPGDTVPGSGGMVMVVMVVMVVAADESSHGGKEVPLGGRRHVPGQGCDIHAVWAWTIFMLNSFGYLFSPCLLSDIFFLHLTNARIFLQSDFTGISPYL